MKYLVYIGVFFFAVNTYGQKSLSKLLKKHNTENIAYVSVEDVNNLIKNAKKTNTTNNLVLLDARERKEYQISHIKNAVFVGYDDFNLKEVSAKIPNKNATIIVYCSLGIRSEDVAEKLHRKGYKNVFNLFGGIFEWKNKGNTVIDANNLPTEKIHTFNKEWSKWLKKGVKIYE